MQYDVSTIQDYDKLRKLQLTQLEMLKYVDSFCKANGINYSIAYGTLLGAVRHKGFIPWDDDLDICMPRDDYNKFIELWKDTDTYLLQNHNTDNDFSQSFTKIRKKNTAFVQEVDLNCNYHKGIFIDIFPFDRVPEGKFNRYLQMYHAMMYQLFLRKYPPEKNGTILKIGSKIILTLIPKKMYPSMVKRHYVKMCKYNSESNLGLADMSVFSTIKSVYTPDFFEDYVMLEFEKISVRAAKNYKDMLIKVYGDYMQLPPENERNWFHHPIYISFEHNYENRKI